MFGRPSESLFTLVAGTPEAFNKSQVPPVAKILNPSPESFLATLITSALSLRFTEIKTVPSNGSLD